MDKKYLLWFDRLICWMWLIAIVMACLPFGHRCWWRVIVVASAVPAFAGLLVRATLIRLGRGAPPTAPPASGPSSGGTSVLPTAGPPAGFDDRMKYAWGWFQYHADQRLKAFNYFLVIIAFLVTAYGAVLKEASGEAKSQDYPWYAVVIAGCGCMIAIAFFFIELRNTELVDCGREWLDRLEGELNMDIRQRDVGRTHVSRIVTALPLPYAIIKHGFWIRAIYIMALVGFAQAAWFAYSKVPG
jgi:hypothetical protein